jgi:hypothetical protein
MRRIALLVVALLCSSVSSSSFAGDSLANPSAQDSSQLPQAQALLQRSYELAMSKEVRQLDRIRLLNNIVIVAPDIAPKQKVIDWATTLIALANDPDYKTVQGVTATDPMAFKKNAIVAMSKIDSKRAMAEFSNLGSYAANEQGEKPEDIRAFGARVVFLNYFKDYKHNSLPEIEAASANLARDGSYPFHAISLIIVELATEEGSASEDAKDLFDNALKHYTCPAKVTNQDNEFLTFIENIKPVLSGASAKKAVSAFKDHLTKPECNIQLPDTYAATIETTQGTVRFNDKRKALLFQAFPLIDEVDHDLGNILLAENSELQKATAINYFWSTRFNGSPSLQDQAAAEEIGLQLSLKQAIAKARDSNPAAALEMASLLKNQGSKLTQTASILPSLARKDLQRTKQLYNEALNDFNALEDESQKAQARVWMAEAAYQTEDLNTFRYLGTETFSEGLKAFQNSRKDIAVDKRTGYAELVEFVRFASAHGITWPLDEIEQISDKSLESALLMYAAIGRVHS